jgi:pimeloyl-ACP methyl ester carboxylesterase
VYRPPKPPPAQSAYLGGPARYPTVAVVFVHGIFGTKGDTWLNQESSLDRQTSFPALLAADPEFHEHTDIFLFEYHTPWFSNAASIVELAGQLRGSLEDHRVFEDHKNVIFLSHSMGGLVVRQYLLTKHDLSQVPMLYFYATPTNGVQLTEIALMFSWNPQLRGMLILHANDLLQSMQSQWFEWEQAKQVPSYCAFETLPTYGVLVVPRDSATALCNQPPDPITADHFDIVKPRNREDPVYSRFAAALRKSVTLEEKLAPPLEAPAVDARKFVIEGRYEMEKSTKARDGRVEGFIANIRPGATEDELDMSLENTGDKAFPTLTYRLLRFRSNDNAQQFHASQVLEEWFYSCGDRQLSATPTIKGDVSFERDANGQIRLKGTLTLSGQAFCHGRQSGSLQRPYKFSHIQI